jgi:hypothetical protein
MVGVPERVNNGPTEATVTWLPIAEPLFVAELSIEL